jgi:hypothetical protein
VHRGRIIVIAALATTFTTLHNPEPDRPCGGILALDLKNTELVELQHLIEQSMKRP